MLKMLSRLGLIATPAFIATHLINENKDNTRKYCPFVKYKKIYTEQKTRVSPKNNDK